MIATTFQIPSRIQQETLHCIHKEGKLKFIWSDVKLVSSILLLHLNININFYKVDNNIYCYLLHFLFHFWVKKREFWSLFMVSFLLCFNVMNLSVILYKFEFPICLTSLQFRNHKVFQNPLYGECRKVKWIEGLTILFRVLVGIKHCN